MADFVLKIVDGRVLVEVAGSSLLAPLVAATERARDDAIEASQDAAAAAGTALAAGRYFKTVALGEVGTAVDGLFATDDGAGSLIYYRRTAGGSVEIGRAVTPAALAGDGGAELVAVKADGVDAVRRTVADKAADFVSIADYATPQAAVTHAKAIGADVYVPAGEFVGDVDDTSDVFFFGPGRVVDSAGVQRNTYADPRSRLVFGEEYLYAFHKAVQANDVGTPLDLVFSGDSTTYGSFNGQTLPGPDRIQALSDAWLDRYGITGPVSHNRGTNGITTREWIGPPLGIPNSYTLDQTKAEFPNMICWTLRLGLNDGSTTQNGYRNIVTYRANIREALTRIRAWKGVGELTIVLMSPNATSETGLRDEEWADQVSRVLKRAARDFKCVFIDTHALFSDARAGINLWMDDDGQLGSAIHPEGIHNRIIMAAYAEVVYRPLATFSRSTNNYLNISGKATRALGANVPVASFVMGTTIFRTDLGNTFPLDGIVIVTKSADGVARQENVGFELTAEGRKKRTFTRYGLDGTPWSEWRGLDFNPPLAAGWTQVSGPLGLYPSYLKTAEGTVCIQGRVKNPDAAIGTLIFSLPAGFRPLVNMRFPVHNADGSTFGVLEVQTDGSVVYVSGDKADLIFSFTFLATD